MNRDAELEDGDLCCYVVDALMQSSLDLWERWLSLQVSTLSKKSRSLHCDDRDCEDEDREEESLSWHRQVVSHAELQLVGPFHPIYNSS